MCFLQSFHPDIISVLVYHHVQSQTTQGVYDFLNHLLLLNWQIQALKLFTNHCTIYTLQKMNQGIIREWLELKVRCVSGLFATRLTFTSLAFGVLNAILHTLRPYGLGNNHWVLNVVEPVITRGVASIDRASNFAWSDLTLRK